MFLQKNVIKTIKKAQNSSISRTQIAILHAHNLPRWWNGRHWGLKIPWGQLRAGSSPAPGIVFSTSQKGGKS